MLVPTGHAIPRRAFAPAPAPKPKSVERVLLGHPRIESLLLQAQRTRTLHAADLRKLIDGVFSGVLLQPRGFAHVQSILRALRVYDGASKKLIAEFVGLSYLAYMQRFFLALAARSAVPYRIDHIPKTTAHNRRPGTKLTPVYLTIHSTANDKSAASGERAWLTNPSNNRAASFHVVVDENEAVECIPLTEIAWHAGDGNGNGNMKSLSMEICESGDRARTLKNAVKLAAKLLRDQGLAAAALRKHNDWSGKICPRILLEEAHRQNAGDTWKWFTDEVTAILG